MDRTSEFSAGFGGLKLFKVNITGAFIFYFYFLLRWNVEVYPIIGVFNVTLKDSRVFREDL